jgi:hypothetical protein
MPPSKQPAARPADKPTVTFRCGHALPLKSFQAGDCPKCQRQARSRKHQRRQSGRCRLPHDATFLVTYDAPAECWSGTLEVPGVGSFSGTSRAVFHLLQLLDDQYRTATAGKECEQR